MRKPWGWQAFFLAFVLMLTGIAVPQSASAAQKKPKLNKKSAALQVGSTFKLKVTKTKKKVKWSVKSGKKYVSLKDKKKQSVTVKGEKAGTAKIVAKVDGKKLTCKVKVAKAEEKKKEEKKKEEVTGEKGQNIELPAEATVFTAGEHRLSLGITTENVKTILGSLSTDIMREEVSPQGFNVITFNPNGSYNGYLIIYLKDGVVVGICGIGKELSFGDRVKTGMSAETLESNENWSPDSWFSAKDEEGNAAGNGAYRTTTDDAEVIAYADALRDNRVYCIQAYSKNYGADAMTKPGESNSYSDAVLKAMRLEVMDLIQAYLAFCDLRVMTEHSSLTTTAQDYCDEKCIDEETEVQQRSNVDLLYAMLDQDIDPCHYAESSLIGSADAIGFANSLIENQKANQYLTNLHFVDEYEQVYNYQYFGVAVAALQSDSEYYTYLVVDFCCVDI